MLFRSLNGAAHPHCNIHRRYWVRDQCRLDVYHRLSHRSSLVTYPLGQLYHVEVEFALHRCQGYGASRDSGRGIVTDGRGENKFVYRGTLGSSRNRIPVPVAFASYCSLSPPEGKVRFGESKRQLCRIGSVGSIAITRRMLKVRTDSDSGPVIYCGEHRE